MAGDNNKQNKQGKGPEGQNPSPKFNGYWIYILVAFFLMTLMFWDFGGKNNEITFQRLTREMLDSNYVEKIVVVNDRFAEVHIKSEHLKKFKELEGSTMLGSSQPYFVYNFLTLEKFEEEIRLKYPEVILTKQFRRDWSGTLLNLLVPIALLVLLWVVVWRMMNRGGGGGGGQIFNIGKSRAQLFDKGASVSINFQDVAGLEEAKVEVMEIVDFLRNPKKYTQLGGKIPKGALLVGPPGTGKTLLAKAVAGEAKVPFFSLSGSDFVEMFVGVGASRVRDLFKNAKEKAPCIIFIDEIDAIGRARGRNAMTGANDERENTLNQLLTEMDGFSTNSGVIIMAATNRADILDRALMRAGRFDRQIHVELPDLEERKAIFKVHMRALKFGNDTDVTFLSRQTPGFSGADIANVCNEAALIAARKNKNIIEKQDFMDAIDRIVGGLEKKNKIISPKEKEVIAFHEAGHATVSWMLQYAHPLVKVTIVPRGKALGAAWYLPEERSITTYEQLFHEMTTLLGGRAAEDLIFGKVSTGALNDLERVTRQAYAMVVYFGLNSKIGNLSFYDSTGQNEYSFTKPYSEKTAETIDAEISKLVEEAYNNALKILGENKSKLRELASRLLSREVIFREDLEEIFGKRPWDDDPQLMVLPPNGQNGLNQAKDTVVKELDAVNDKNDTTPELKSEEEEAEPNA
jgi:AFG3 family protein